MIVRRQLAPGAQIRQVELAEPARPLAQPAAPGAERARDRGPRHARAAARLLRGADERRPPVADLPHARAARDGAAAHGAACPSRPSWRGLAARNDADRARRMDDGDVAGMLVANRAFHFGLFELSPLGAIRQDVERLWNTSEPYRATYLWLPTTRPARSSASTSRCSAALVRGDRARLVQIADRHRGAARARGHRAARGRGPLAREPGAEVVGQRHRRAARRVTCTSTERLVAATRSSGPTVSVSRSRMLVVPRPSSSIATRTVIQASARSPPRRRCRWRRTR